MAARRNRRPKDATTKRHHQNRHDPLRSPLADILNANNVARRLKTLSGLTPYEYIGETRTSVPDRFKPNLVDQMRGTNS